MQKLFDLPVVLSVTHGVLVTPAGLTAVMELCELIMMREMLIDEWGTVRDICAGAILLQYPVLHDVRTPPSSPRMTTEAWLAWPGQEAERLGLPAQLLINSLWPTPGDQGYETA